MKRLWIVLRGFAGLGLSLASLACIDKKPPEVVIVSPESWSNISGNVIIKAEVNDASAIERVSFFVDDSLIAQDSTTPWEYEWNSIEWGDGGKHKIVCSANDKYGNEGVSEFVMVYVYLPSNPPVISYPPWGPGQDLSPDSNLTFYATAIDPNEDSISFQFDWGDGTQSNWTPFVVSGDTGSCHKIYTGEGSFIVRYRAKDLYGVPSEWSQDYTIRISKYGKLMWKCYLGEPVTTSPALGYDGTIHVGTEHYMHAVNPNGTIKWSYEVDPWRVCSSPAVGPDGTIYFGCYYYYLYALNPDGTLKWRYETERRVESSPAIGADGTIYFGTYDSSLVALTPQGKLKWEFKVDGIVKSSPSIDGNGVVYFGAYDKYIYAISSSGTLAWKHYIPSDGLATKIAGTSPAIASDGTVYFETESGYVYSFTASYDLKWLRSVGEPIGVSPAIGIDGTLYITGGRYLHSLDPETQQTKWFSDLGEGKLNSPGIGSDVSIYCGAIDYLYSFNSDGVIKWRYHLGGNLIGVTAIASDGTIYAGSEDGYLYALTTSSKGLCNSSWPRFRHDNQNTGRAGGP